MKFAHRRSPDGSAGTLSIRRDSVDHSKRAAEIKCPACGVEADLRPGPSDHVERCEACDAFLANPLTSKGAWSLVEALAEGDYSRADERKLRDLYDSEIDACCASRAYVRDLPRGAL